VTACIEVTTTLPTRAAAEALGAALVESRLAACAQITGPVASVYRWEGAVQHAEEWYCRVKSTRVRYAALAAAIRARHTYDLPEITATPLEGSAEYLTWIEREVAFDR
jgi:periplasmic divalent cation tolerance protein